MKIQLVRGAILMVAAAFVYITLWRLYPHTGNAAGTGPVQFSNIAISNTNPSLHSVFEIGFDLSTAYSEKDRFNPALVDVSATFSLPDGSVETVPGFYKQDSSPKWAIRYSPRRAGTYTYVLKLKDTNGISTSAQGSFTASNTTANAGFLQVDTNNPARLMTSNGKAFVPNGINIPGCPDNNAATPDPTYATAFGSQMKSYNMNYARMWSGARWGAYAIERYNPQGDWQCGVNSVYKGIGDYNLSNAATADKIFQNAQNSGIYIDWAVAMYEDLQFDLDRQTNAYLSSGGGPVTNCTADNCKSWWTNTQAKNYLKNYMRYIYARWGAYTSLGVIEFFNEADQSFLYDPDSDPPNMTDWHNEMNTYWKTTLGDVYRHPTTTSFAWTDHWTGAGANETPWAQKYQTWTKLSSLDMTSRHLYTDIDKNVVDRILTETTNSIADGAGTKGARPFLFTEYDIQDETLISQDPNGYYHLDAVWVPFFFGQAAGANMRWCDGPSGKCSFLPNATTDKGYKSFGAFTQSAYNFLRTTQFFTQNNLANNIRVGGYKNANGALMMVRDWTATWDIANPVAKNGITVSLPGMTNGTYTVQYWNTLDGTHTDSTATASNGTLTLTLPSFQRAIGVKVFNSNIDSTPIQPTTVPSISPIVSTIPTPTGVQSLPLPTNIPTPTVQITIAPLPTNTPTPKPTATVTPTRTPTKAPMPTLTPAPGVSGKSVITIYAEGKKYSGTGPEMHLVINNVDVKTWWDLGAIKTYAYTAATKVAPNQVQVKYVNDWDTTRALRVDKINIDGVDYQSESPTTSVVGGRTGTGSCGNGNLQTEWLDCNGYFSYSN